MVKVMAINAGSSSLKFQLINMPSEEVITSGIVERIGLEEGNFEMKYNGEKFIKECPIKDHSVAVQLLLDALVDHHVVESLGEIEACGHRVVHGGEYYNDAVKVDEEVVARVEELAELAPLHNPAHIVGYNAFKAANNKKLEKMINTLWEQVQRFRITYVSDSNASLSLIDEHQSILNAIKEGNIADSKKFAIKHIEKAEQFMLEHCTK